MIKSNKMLIGVITAVVVVGFVLGAFGFFKGLQDTKTDVPSGVPGPAVSAFQTELVDRALTRGPHPIEGFSASILLDRFPGLLETDFDQVQTGVGSGEGRYFYTNGDLKWERIDSSQPVTSAERTVSDKGYEMLLKNLSDRLNMSVGSPEEALAVIEIIDIPSDIAEHIASKRDLIMVFSPKPGAVVSSPLTVQGEARGTWYFEADFQLVLTDWDGRIITQGFATAQQDWMTERFVPFNGVIEFENPSFPDAEEAHFSRRGALILQKANPSGLSENADALEIPVLFE